MSKHVKRKARGGTSSRAAWVFADSALSSLTNAGLTIGLARIVSDTQLGAFALSFTLFSLVQAVSMALNNQAVVIRYADKSRAEQEYAGGAAAAGAIAVGAAAGLAMALIGLLVGSTAGLAMIAMGVAMPALMVQDHWRTTFIAFGEPRRAFFLDLLWAVAWAGGFVVLTMVGVREVGGFIVVWGVGALISAVLGTALAGTRPDVRRLRAWFADHTEVSMPSLANTVATIGAAQVAFLLISVIGSIRDLGALRGVQTLLGPLNIVGFAVVAFVTPELIRRRPGPAGLRAAAVAMGAVMVLITATWGGLLLLLPDSAGRQLLGETWPAAREAMPGFVLYQVAIVSVIGVSVVLRALDRVRSVFYLSALLGPLVIGCSVVGVVLDGARGAAYGFAVAGALVVVPSVVSLLRWSAAGVRGTSIEAKT